jgi:hypothetical protein
MKNYKSYSFKPESLPSKKEVEDYKYIFRNNSLIFDKKAHFNLSLEIFGIWYSEDLFEINSASLV